MSTNRVNNDVINTVFIMNDLAENNYDKLYFSSNELLYKIFSNFSVENKDVLTVLGSGDQMFHCYKNGAKSVDCFDINPLTIHYLYLRRWVIEYLNQFYPDRNFTSNDIKKILKKISIRTENEKDSCNYWNSLARYNNFNSSKMFYEEIVKQNESNEIQDLSLIKKRLSDEFSFYNFNIIDYTLKDKKYDVIITSNIAEYIRNSFSLMMYCDNLCGMLKDNGIVVCSNLGRSSVEQIEYLTFEDNFSMTPMKKEVSWGRNMSLGYVYRKIK